MVWQLSKTFIQLSFFYLFLSSSLFASLLCDPESDRDSLDHLAVELAGLGWFSSTSTQVEESKCAASSDIGLAEMEKQLINPYSPKKDAAIMGVSFKDEDPRLLDLFKKLVDPNLISASFRKVPAVDIRSLIPSNCAKVLCAVKTIFGESEAVQLLYMLDKFGLNGSHLVFDQANAWQKDELEIVLKGLNDLPPFAQKMFSNQPFYHYKRGENRGNPNVLANAVMEYFDRWNKQTATERRYTIFHELAHNMAYFSNGDNWDYSPTWLGFSQWEKKGDKWSAKNLEHIASRYGNTNPVEDFAESVSVYRYHPDAKAILGDEKYQFIKETIYLGLEYNQEGNCLPTKSYLSPSSLSPSHDPRFTSESLNKCLSNLVDSVEQHSTSGFDTCFMTNYAIEERSRAVEKANFKYPQFIKKRIEKVAPQPADVGIASRELQQTKDYFHRQLANALDLHASSFNLFSLRVSDKFLNLSDEAYCAQWSQGSGEQLALEMGKSYRNHKNHSRLYRTASYESLAKRMCLHLRQAKMPLNKKNFIHSIGTVLH